MSQIKTYLFYLCFILIASSCNSTHKTEIRGNIDYTGSSKIFIEEQPVHYKYADNILYPVQTNQNGDFELTVEPDSAKVYFLNIDDQQYPVIVIPGLDLFLHISRQEFPVSVKVTGYPQPWDDRFSLYLKELRPIGEQIEKELPLFRSGKSDSVIKLYAQRYRLAEKHLANTPLDIYYYKAIGEYLVKRLEHIKYTRGYPGSDPELERQNIIKEAKDLDFFSIRSLKAQRAGIRDFTNAYAHTFGVKERLEKEYGQELTQYDVNQLGYKTLDSARVSVLTHIDSRHARAYAKMHLIAERIGEISPAVAKESYQKYLASYQDFPVYTDFLTKFYREVESVSPGNPAVPFTLPDQNNNQVSMKDFRGRYVLLDFWASWCIPCLNEFSYMKDLYHRYSRDQFEIAAISTEEDSLRWRQAIQRFDNPWHQLYGGDGFQQETFRTYKGGGIPFYILVDPEGNILRYNDIRPSFNLPEVLDSLIVS